MIPQMFPETNTKVTLELREVIAGGVNLWDFDYPSFYKGDDKTAFEKKVIDHFYFRQIGAETVGRFLHFFRRTVREIMPLYIQRYESVEMMKDPEIKPLDNYNMIEEYEQDTTETGQESMTGTTSGTGKTSGNSSGESTHNTTNSENRVHAEHDTPQGALSLTVDDNGNTIVNRASMVGQDVNKNTQNETSQASEESETTSETSGTSENTSDTTKTGNVTHKLTRRGNIGVTTYSQLLEGYRQTFLNIDMEIIQELDSCFMGVY